MELHHPRLSAGIRSNGSRVTHSSPQEQGSRNLLAPRNLNLSKTKKAISFGSANFRYATTANQRRLNETHRKNNSSQSRQNTSPSHRFIPNYHPATFEEQELRKARVSNGVITPTATNAAPRLNANSARLYANYSARYEDPYNMRRKISTNSRLNNYKQLRRNLLAKWNYEYKE